MKPYCYTRTSTGTTPFGERLKQERLMRGFSLTKFAEAVGVSASQISGFENRGIVPCFKTVIAMAEVPDCSLDFLAGLEAA